MESSFVLKEISESSGCTEADNENLWRMLLHAAHEKDLESVKSNALLKPYVENFGEQKGDLAIVAFHDVRAGHGKHEEAVGAAWVRIFPGGGLATSKMDASCNDLRDFPELAVACSLQYRGQGLGSQLLLSLITRLKEMNEKGGLVLSCRTENNALRLYERLGFEIVPGSLKTNRVGGTSVTMKCVW